MQNEQSLSESIIEKEERFGAHNYRPIPVVLTHAKGCHAWDVDGFKYVDMMSAYSAVSLGHANPHILATLKQQASKLAVTSRAYHNEKLPQLLQSLCEVTGLEQALPMNTGAEAVDTALKIARKWAEKIKGVPKDGANIIACRNNFHGRTMGAVSLSTEEQYKEGFGPLLPGIRIVDFGDTQALEQAIDGNTAAFIVEPIQGEAGIIVPAQGYLKKVHEICQRHNILLICDEIQTGLGRTGKLFCFQHEEILPDMVLVGKALGGGVYPVSAVVGKKHCMKVMTPGDHGSTFGGNALASAIGVKALEMINSPQLMNHVQQLGTKSLEFLRQKLGTQATIKEIRGMGLFIGIEFHHAQHAKQAVKQLTTAGILTKDTHHVVIRIAPPLVISEQLMMKTLQKIVKVINQINH